LRAIAFKPGSERAANYDKNTTHTFDANYEIKPLTLLRPVLLKGQKKVLVEGTTYQPKQSLFDISEPELYFQVVDPESIKHAAYIDPKDGRVKIGLTFEMQDIEAGAWNQTVNPNKAINGRVDSRFIVPGDVELHIPNAHHSKGNKKLIYLEDKTFVVKPQILSTKSMKQQIRGKTYE